MPVDFRNIPGTTKLFSDFLYDFGQVEKFYAGDFRKDKNYLRVFKSIKERKYQREKLCSILNTQNQRFGAPEEVFKKIELLNEPDSLVIFTGQQVCLFGGPLFIIFKAISTLKLAEELSFRFSRNFIPVFWLDSEDHDFEEVRSTSIIDKENKLQEIKYSPLKIPSGEPMYRILLEGQIDACLDLLKSSVHPTEFKDEITRVLSNCYSAGESISTSFAKWLVKLLGKYGLVIADPGDRELKKLATGFFLEETENPGKSMKLVMETGKALESSGYHQQVIKSEDAVNLFLEMDDKRCSLKWNGDSIEIDGVDRKLSLDELRRIIKQEPERVSPNVLLLPLMRSYLFPTVAYIGGPGEISYYAQLKSVFEFFEIPMPVVYPRASVTLVEGKIKQVLDKYSLEFTNLFQDPEIVINSILKGKFPDSLEIALEKKRNQISKILDELEQELVSSEPTLKQNLETSRGKIDYELKRLGEKLFQTYRQKDQNLKDQVYKARNNLFPGNKLQERVLNLTPYLIKYGFEFVDFLYNKVEIEKVDHQLLEIG